MTFRLACADFTFPLLAHGQALDVIAMLGVDGVEIGLLGAFVRSTLLTRSLCRFSTNGKQSL